jgi:hypothetical protein
MTVESVVVQPIPISCESIASGRFDGPTSTRDDQTDLADGMP